MARRNDHSKEEIREMAILTGKELIAEQGIAKFSVREVARRIGYTVGTLYNLFESQDDLLIHIKACILDEMDAFLVGKINLKLNPPMIIKQLAKQYLAYAKTHYHSWQLIFEHHSQPEFAIPDWYTTRINKMFIPLKNCFSSVVSDTQSDLAAKTLWAAIHGICALGLAGKLDMVKVESIQKLIDSLIDNYLKGIMYEIQSR